MKFFLISLLMIASRSVYGESLQNFNWVFDSVSGCAKPTLSNRLSLITGSERRSYRLCDKIKFLDFHLEQLSSTYFKTSSSDNDYRSKLGILSGAVEKSAYPLNQFEFIGYDSVMGYRSMNSSVSGLAEVKGATSSPSGLLLPGYVTLDGGAD
jgi:hypothetical protein